MAEWTRSESEKDLNFSKISCHDLTVTEKGDDCFDGYLYNWDGKA